MSTIERLKELLSVATPSPWEDVYGYNNGGIPTGGLKTVRYTTGGDWAPIEDVELIAEMRNTLPKLLAVVEAAEAVLDEADPRKYGDMTAKQSDLADKLVALHENSVPE